MNERVSLVCFKESWLRWGLSLVLTRLLLNVGRVGFTSSKITAFNHFLCWAKIARRYILLLHYHILFSFLPFFVPRLQISYPGKVILKSQETPNGGVDQRSKELNRHWPTFLRTLHTVWTVCLAPAPNLYFAADPVWISWEILSVAFHNPHE